MCFREPPHIFRQKRHIGCLQRDVRSRRTHGDADVGAGKRSRVVDAVSDERDLARGCELADHADLVLGQHVGMDFLGLQSEFLADPQGNRPAVARHHDDLADPAFP